MLTRATALLVNIRMKRIAFTQGSFCVPVEVHLSLTGALRIELSQAIRKIWCNSGTLSSSQLGIGKQETHGYLVGGFNPSEKYEFVSWDHYSQYMESHKIHVPNHQPVYIYHIIYIISQAGICVPVSPGFPPSRVDGRKIDPMSSNDVSRPDVWKLLWYPLVI